MIDNPLTTSSGRKGKDYENEKRKKIVIDRYF